MYPLQMRMKVLKIKLEEKLSIRNIASRFGISPTTVFKWIKNIEPKIKRKKLATKIDMKALQRDVKENPALYQYERADKLGVSQRAIGYALKRLDISYKKNSQTSKGKRGKAYYLRGNNC